jgi:hypothetical protein
MGHSTKTKEQASCPIELRRRKEKLDGWRGVHPSDRRRPVLFSDTPRRQVREEDGCHDNQKVYFVVGFQIVVALVHVPKYQEVRACRENERVPSILGPDAATVADSFLRDPKYKG